MKGHFTPHSEETKRKISLSKKGKPSNRKGAILSEESRKKISLRNKGYKHSLEAKQKMSLSRLGDNNHFHNKIHSIDSRKKMSESRKKFLKESGQKPWNYIEDRSKLAKRQIRNDSAYIEWRSSVLKRDNWKCQLANEKCEGKIVVHHIFPWHQFPTLRYKLANGITLCHIHHPRKRDEEKRMIHTLLVIVLSK